MPGHEEMMPINTRSGWPGSLLGLFNFPFSGLIWPKNSDYVSVFINTNLKIGLPTQCVILIPADIGLKCLITVCLGQLSPSPFMVSDTEAIGYFPRILLILGHPSKILSSLV